MCLLCGGCVYCVVGVSTLWQVCLVCGGCVYYCVVSVFSVCWVSLLCDGRVYCVVVVSTVWWVCLVCGGCVYRVVVVSTLLKYWLWYCYAYCATTYI